MHISLQPDILFTLGSFPISNTLFVSSIAASILIAGALFIRMGLADIPGRFQALIELVLEGLLALLDSVTQDREKSTKFFPLVVTIFLFILVQNWLGILPIFGSVSIASHGTFIPIFRTANSDLNNTMALALIAVIAIQVFGISSIGFMKYVSKFLSFGSPVGFFVGILEAISEFAKIISFSFRLFGNIFAGEVLLVVIAFLFPYFLPIPFMGLEIFVGFIQALVFAILTLVFLTMATAEH